MRSIRPRSVKLGRPRTPVWRPSKKTIQLPSNDQAGPYAKAPDAVGVEGDGRQVRAVGMHGVEDAILVPEQDGAPIR
jgi:hypothetical protein